MDDLKGRVALITGGGRGIGRASTLALAEAGGHVAINYVRRRADAEDVAAAIRVCGRRTAVLQADGSKSADVRGLVSKVEGALGPIVILVNNAGRLVVEGIEQ